jgi:hypothetical protein
VRKCTCLAAKVTSVKAYVVPAFVDTLCLNLWPGYSLNVVNLCFTAGHQNCFGVRCAHPEGVSNSGCWLRQRLVALRVRAWPYLAPVYVLKGSVQSCACGSAVVLPAR